MKSVCASVLSWISSTSATCGREKPQLLERLEQPRPLELRRVRVQEECGGSARSFTSSTARRRNSRLSSHCASGPSVPASRTAPPGSPAGSGWRPRPSASYADGCRAGGEDDRLEEHRDRGGVEQLAHRAPAPPRSAGSAGHAHGRASSSRLGLGRVAGHAELVVADVQHVALVQRRIAPPAAVQERRRCGCRGRARAARPVGVDLGVELRDEAGLEKQRARPWCGRAGTAAFWIGVRCRLPCPTTWHCRTQGDEAAADGRERSEPGCSGGRLRVGSRSVSRGLCPSCGRSGLTRSPGER